ncbi:MAG: E3 binding domain-containing protein, partial [Anaerolineales bacterium]|nr:E3 binding domain-containing protein [Anaerolineales bacterium]
YEPILEIETDKVTTEVVAEAEGVLSAILAQEGETVQVGQVLGVIGGERSAVSSQQSAVSGQVHPEGQASHSDVSSQPTNQLTNQPTNQPAIQRAIQPPTQTTPQDEVEVRSYPRTLNGTRVSPVVARMVAEHEIDIAQVEGSGRGGRVTKRDVEEFLAGTLRGRLRTQSVSRSVGQPTSQPSQPTQPTQPTSQP